MPKRDQTRYEPELLRQLFFIAPLNGAWRVFHACDRIRKDGWTLARRGDLADTYIDPRGYRRCALPRENRKQRFVLAHCVIWALFHNRNPGEFLVDHQDRDTTHNDPISNLRLADDFASIINRAQNAEGPIGVWERLGPRGMRYRAVMSDPATKMAVSLGTYATLREAQLVVDAFIVRYRGADAPTNASLGRLAAA